MELRTPSWRPAPAFIATVRLARNVASVGAVAGVTGAACVAIKATPWLALPALLGAVWFAGLARGHSRWLGRTARGETLLAIEADSIRFPEGLVVERSEVREVRARRGPLRSPTTVELRLRERRWRTGFSDRIVVRVGRYENPETLIEALEGWGRASG